ncbi:MAG: GTP cyclohydrolase I FolE [Bacteroides sp.]|nr:GTP cyclohydrolase I FolE [Bacteroidales bacterium]MBD5316991.1 GTP cyclohydrolase I FolE [Bacteroides sp.]MBD5376354.1 GTP cyclohydrolase I FolE [Bacteroides sp.]
MQPDNNTVNSIAAHVEAILRLLGENPEREGLVKTPVRAAKALLHATQGYHRTEGEVINGAVFTHEGSGMIMVRDIEFYSMCEHHVLPFFGKVSVGYLPKGKVLGLSKLARLVDIYARRLQLQERLTAEVLAAVVRATGSPDVIVTCTAEHLCMKMRGVEKQDSSTTTIETSGVFATDASLRQMFLTR